MIRPGETLQLTLKAWRATTEPLEEVLLTLDLPDELKPAKGKTELQWRLPELGQTELFTQVIEAQLVGGAFPFETAVGRVVLHTAATDRFSANRVEVVVGIESRASEPPASPVAKAKLSEKGLILRGRHGDVTLLVEAGTAETETDFEYTDGYRWGENTPSSSLPEPVEGSEPSASSGEREEITSSDESSPLSQSSELLYLPVIRNADGVAEAQGRVDPASQRGDELLTKEEPKVDGGIRFVRQWRLDATYQGQKRDAFAKRVHLLVDANWLLERGFDPGRLALYTRHDAEQAWEQVPGAIYDETAQQFRARVPHFSEYGLGLDNNVVGESVPDVSAFGNELFTGAATVQYPLALPTGAGGLAPGLHLGYSTATVDNQRWDNNKNNSNGYRVQAGLPGIGWTLGGLGYIAYLSTGGDPNNGNDDHYSLVINGTMNEFRYSDTQTESFAKIEKVLTTTVDINDDDLKVSGTGHWSITMPNGIKHIFGGAPVDPRTPSTTASQGVLLWDFHRRWVNKWYLSKTVDPNGNYIEYNYESDKRNTSCSTNPDYNGDGGWYYRSIRPVSIYWGGNETTGLSHKLRVLLSYEERTDTGIYERDHGCRQSMYSTKRVKGIRVEAYSENAWRPLHDYELSYLYTTGYHQHSWLQTIKHYGFGGNGVRTADPLQTHTFDYTIGDIHSEVYLQTANNGWGGKVVYYYAAPATWRCEIDRRVNCDQVAYRRQVAAKEVYDGTNGSGGQWRRTHYGYGEGLYRHYKNDPVVFLGYPTAWSVSYVTNSSTTEARVTEHWFYRNNGYSDRGDIANNPDPLMGRVDYERILQPGTSGCPSGQVAGSRCKMAETDHTYTALTGSGTSWSTTTNYSDHPRWVRHDEVTNWVDGASNTQKFFYKTSRQNNTQYGNLTRTEEFSGTTKLRTTYTTYYPHTTNHIVNRPGRRWINNESGLCVADEHFHYDGNSSYSSAPTKGLLTKQVTALTNCWSGNPSNDGHWTITAWEYDAYGNPTKEIPYGAGSNIETKYDSTYHHFPIERWLSTNPAYKERVSYYGVNSGPGITDYRAHWGQVAEFCGVNEVCTRYGYDDYGRTNLRWEGIAMGSAWSNQTSTNANIVWQYSMYGASGLTRNVITEWRVPRCYGNFTRKVYDGLGQLIQSQGPQENWTTNKDGCNPGLNKAEVDISYDYDALGNQTRVGVPVATSASSINRAANWGAGYTATTYDVLGRPKTVAAPNGETTAYKYVGRSTRVVAEGYGSENGTDRVIKWTETDALGHLYRVRTYARPWQPGDTELAEILLTHDVRGNLTQVNHPNDIGTTTMSYDVGGRKISMSDPDLGNWTYAYDRRSRLTRQTDARSKTTCLYYDSHSRLAGKHFRDDTSCPGSVGTYDVSYGYDAGHNSSNRSRGQLTSVANAGYNKVLTYNDIGMVAKESVNISGASTYNTEYLYDKYLRRYAVKYPDGEIVRTEFNSMALPDRLCAGSWNGITEEYDCTALPPYYVDEVGYDAAGRLTQMKFGLGGDLWRTQYYHGWTATNSTYPGSGNGRLDEIRIGTTAGSSNRTLLIHDYDSFGNLERQVENGLHRDFSYDDQNRVVSSDGKIYGYTTTGEFTHFASSGTTYQYSTPKDTNNRHGVKWVKVGSGGTTNQTVKIRAKGSYSAGWPTMQLWVNGVLQQSWTVSSSNWGDYTVTVPLTGQAQIDVVFTNDYSSGGQDRNLYIDWIQVNGVTLQENVGIVDRGDGNAAFDGNDILPGNHLYWNGALRFVVGSGGTVMGYDLNGNMTYKLQQGLAKIYEWNHENQLASVTQNGSTLESYLYDADGIRVKKSAGGIHTYYVNRYYETTQESTAQAASATTATISVEPTADESVPVIPPIASQAPAAVEIDASHQLFLPLVGGGTQRGQRSLQTATPSVVYLDATTGEACDAQAGPLCTGWIVTYNSTDDGLNAESTIDDGTATQTTAADAVELSVSDAPTDDQLQALFPSTETIAVTAPLASSLNLSATVNAAAVDLAVGPTDPSFEGSGWGGIRSSWYPGTALYRRNWGTADGRSGAYGYGVGNLADGYLFSNEIGITGGQSYSLHAWLKGEIDSDDNGHLWYLRVHFYDSTGTNLGYTNVTSGSTLTAGYTKYGGSFTTPANATKLRVMVLAHEMAGWLTVDDVELKQGGTGPNLVPNASFESSGSWSEIRSNMFPGTAFLRTTWGTAAPHSGSYGYTISNHTYGVIESDPITVDPNTTYDLYAYLGGEVDTDDSYGPWVIRARFYNSSGTYLSYSDAAVGYGSVTKWTYHGGQVTTPSNATTVRIHLMFYMASGWMTFDDVEFKRVNTTQNLAPNPSFESGTGWTAKPSTYYPNTSILRSTWGTAGSRTGSYAYAISNHAYGYLESAPMTVTGGQSYELATYLRGKIDSLGTLYGWILRARFYRSDGSYISYADAKLGYNGQEISTEWQRMAGTVVAPNDAATMRLNLYHFMSSGWVAFDDVSVSTAPVVTKYYYFNGQRIAMRKDGVLRYLHGDGALHPLREHLGSVGLVTDADGTVANRQGYHAYGKQRHGDDLLTDHGFTGHKQDGTGLIYMNARYYDPEIGQFISPDTIVPDPTVLIDYNRFAYARANPLKYNDPGGSTPWDVVDAIFWAMSARDMYNDPSWGNAGWLTLDTLGMLPIIPSVGGWVRRGPEAVKITNQARKLVSKHGVDLAIEFTHVAHKPGADTLLEKLISSAEPTVKGALFELEYARKYTDKIVEIGRKEHQVFEIDFVLEGNVFVNVKDFDWSSSFYQKDFGIERVIDEYLRQVERYRDFGKATEVQYIFKGGVPDAIRNALEEVGVIVEVVE